MLVQLTLEFMNRILKFTSKLLKFTYKTPVKVIQNCGSHNFVALSNGTWKKAPVYNIWVTAAETTKLFQR